MGSLKIGDRVVFNGYGNVEDYWDDENIGKVGIISDFGLHYTRLLLDDGGSLLVELSEVSLEPSVRQSILSEVEALMDEYDTVVHDSVPTQEAIVILHEMLKLIEAVPWEPSVLREAFMRLAVGALAIAQNVDSEAVEAAEEADVAF